MLICFLCFSCVCFLLENKYGVGTQSQLLIDDFKNTYTDSNLEKYLIYFKINNAVEYDANKLKDLRATEIETVGDENGSLVKCFLIF